MGAGIDYVVSYIVSLYGNHSLLSLFYEVFDQNMFYNSALWLRNSLRLEKPNSVARIIFTKVRSLRTVLAETSTDSGNTIGMVGNNMPRLNKV